MRFLAAHDSGRVMNRLTYDNQVIGGITMGIGLAMTEQRVLDRQTGKMVNRQLARLQDPDGDGRAGRHDVAARSTSHDPEANTTGAKGLGEPATIPTAAAIANAVYNAIGVRVTESPDQPDAARRACSRHAGRGGEPCCPASPTLGQGTYAKRCSFAPPPAPACTPAARTCSGACATASSPPTRW